MSDRTHDIVAIGASWGGLAAIQTVLRTLPATLAAAVVVAQHRSPDSHPTAFRDLLDGVTPLKVCEPLDKDMLEPGTVYISVRGPNIGISADGRIEAARDQRSPHRPSIDAVFASAAASFGAQALGVLLTGMGEDGAAGMAAISAAGGLTVAQDEATSTVYGMPRAAVERGAARLVLPDHELARAIQSAVANGG